MPVEAVVDLVEIDLVEVALAAADPALGSVLHSDPCCPYARALALPVVELLYSAGSQQIVAITILPLILFALQVRLVGPESLLSIYRTSPEGLSFLYRRGLDRLFFAARIALSFAQSAVDLVCFAVLLLAVPERWPADFAVPFVAETATFFSGNSGDTIQLVLRPALRFSSLLPDQET